MTRAQIPEGTPTRDSRFKTVVAVVGVLVNAARFIWEIIHR